MVFLLLSSFIVSLSLILGRHINVRVVVRSNLHFIMVTISSFWFWKWSFISESTHFSFSHEEIAARLSLNMIIILVGWTVFFCSLFNCHHLMIHTQIAIQLTILTTRIWISSFITVSLARSGCQERIMRALENLSRLISSDLAHSVWLICAHNWQRTRVSQLSEFLPHDLVLVP